MAIAEITHRPGSSIIGGIKVTNEVDLDQTPYNIRISPIKLAKIYAQMRFSTAETSQQELLLKARSVFPTSGETHNVAGTSHPTKPIVTLYTDWVWRMRQDDMLEVIDYIKAKEQQRIIKKMPNFNSFQSPQRIEAYLNAAPPDRAIEFMHKLITGMWDNRLNSVLIHELQHQRDTSGYVGKLLASIFSYGGEITAIVFGLKTGILAQEMLPNFNGLMQPGVDAFLATASILQPFLKLQFMQFNPFETRARKAQSKLASATANAITLEAKQ